CPLAQAIDAHRGSVLPLGSVSEEGFPVHPPPLIPEMANNNQVSTDTIASLDEVRKQLTELVQKLAEANQECAIAGRPLDNLAQLDLAQRQDVAQRIRAAEREWETVAQLVDQVLAKKVWHDNDSRPSPVGDEAS